MKEEEIYHNIQVGPRVNVILPCSYHIIKWRRGIHEWWSLWKDLKSLPITTLRAVVHDSVPKCDLYLQDNTFSKNSWLSVQK